MNTIKLPRCAWCLRELTEDKINYESPDPDALCKDCDRESRGKEPIEPTEYLLAPKKVPYIPIGGGPSGYEPATLWKRVGRKWVEVE